MLARYSLYWNSCVQEYHTHGQQHQKTKSYFQKCCCLSFDNGVWSSSVYSKSVIDWNTDENVIVMIFIALIYSPDSKAHGANMGPTCVLSAPGGPHVGPINFAIREVMRCTGSYHFNIGTFSKTSPPCLGASDTYEIRVPSTLRVILKITGRRICDFGECDSLSYSNILYLL